MCQFYNEKNANNEKMSIFFCKCFNGSYSMIRYAYILCYASVK